MAITKITYHAADDALPSNESEQYRAFAEQYLRAEFPTAEIMVTSEQHPNNVETDAGADDYADLERVQWATKAAYDAYGRL